jgi:hypothetical protein
MLPSHMPISKMVKPEFKHRHNVEVGLSFLAHASMPLKFWDEAFVTTTYLINRLPTKILNGRSPLQCLFDTTHDYNSLWGSNVLMLLLGVSISPGMSSLMKISIPLRLYTLMQVHDEILLRPPSLLNSPFRDEQTTNQSTISPPTTNPSHESGALWGIAIPYSYSIRYLLCS